MQTVTTVSKAPVKNTSDIKLDMTNPVIKAIVRKSQLQRDLTGRWEFTLDIDKSTADMLLANVDDNQRRLSKGRMLQIRRDIQNDRWENTGDVIRLSPEGRLIDGQHRLTAYAGANVPANVVLKDMTIVILKNRKSLDVVDIGKSRTVGDLRKMTGRAYVQPRAIGGILFEARDFVSRGLSPSKIEQNTTVDTCPYLDEVRSLAGNGAPTPVIGAAIRCMKQDKDKGYRFFLAAVNNEHHLDGKYVSALRVLSTWLMTNTHNGGGHAIRRETVVRCIHAWNAYREGREIKQSRYFASSPIPTAK